MEATTTSIDKTGEQDLFLSRSDHDRLLDANARLLGAAFDTCRSRRWSIEGVKFHGLCPLLVTSIRAALA